jgi:hypothetical protein
MTCNLGRVERTLRILLGVGLIIAGYLAEMPQWAAMVAYFIGATMIVTGAMGFCAAWKMLGIDTSGTRTAAGS